MVSDLFAELQAMREAVGFQPLSGRALVRVSGPDSSRWLNGMVTNSVKDLRPGEGAYCFFLNAQGRIQGDGTVYRELWSERETSPEESPRFLLSTTAAQADVLEAWLDRYIIMDDVELTRLAPEDSSLLVVGPGVPDVLRAVGLPLPNPLALLEMDSPHGYLRLLTPVAGRVPQVEVRGSNAACAAVQSELWQAGAVELSAEALEAWRILQGVPLFGQDIRDRDLPQETAQTHALHFNKGCYLGQEIVERIHSRGQVHRVLTRFTLAGRPPESLPAPLTAAGKAAGEITSFAAVPASSAPSPSEPETENGSEVFALGYVRREALAAGASLQYEGGVALPRD